MKSEEFLLNLISQQPDTKGKFFCVHNVTFFAFLLIGVPLGCTQQLISPSVLRNPLIKCFGFRLRNKTLPRQLVHVSCMFRALAYELNRSVVLQQNTEKLTHMSFSATRKDGNSFPGVHEDDILILKEPTDGIIQVYTIFIDDQSEIYAKLIRRSCLKRAQTTSLLKYDNHICWTADINKFLKKFRCCICDQYFDRSFNLLRHMQNFSKNMQHKYTTGVYQLSETVFERLGDAKNNVPLDLRLFSRLIIFDFESITVPDNTIRNTELTPWIGKHVPINLSITSNQLTQPIFLCNEDPLQLIRNFVSSLTNIAEKSTILIREKLQNFIS